MERPFDYPRNPRFVPTRPDRARGTLTRLMHLKVGFQIGTLRAFPRSYEGKRDLAQLCRLNNYLLRREARMNAEAA